MWLRSALALGILALDCRAADPAPAVPAIDNAIRDCVRFVPGKARSVDSVELLEVTVERVDSTAACGCKSALLRYRVREEIGDTGLESEIVSGRLTSPEGKSATFVIDKNRSVRHRGPRTLGIGCAPPD